VSCELDPPVLVPDPTDDACPGCGATHGVQPQPAPPEVAAWTCRACSLNWACTVIGVLPTPQLHTAAFLAILRAEVVTCSGKDPAP
jgi:hypothetical protein